MISQIQKIHPSDSRAPSERYAYCLGDIPHTTEVCFLKSLDAALRSGSLSRRSSLAAGHCISRGSPGGLLHKADHWEY